MEYSCGEFFFIKEQTLTVFNFVCLCSTHATSAQILCLLRYGPDFLHVIIYFVDIKITFSNMRSHGALSLISEGLPKCAPPPHLAENLKQGKTMYTVILFLTHFVDLL